MTLWTEVDERVLRFVGEMPPSILGVEWQLALRPTVASTDIDGLDERQIDESLLRLQSAGLLEARERAETIGFAVWVRPRVTALALIVLGAWPTSTESTRFRRSSSTLPPWPRSSVSRPGARPCSAQPASPVRLAVRSSPR